ncbi:MAG TPA: S-layer homology domain-containing protein [Candidatus Butyricicoccus stercorigallinarum]|nr:S-layer homology domain-containing protein [Candidatus Butyricicoccus stercorigallinarum]
MKKNTFAKRACAVVAAGSLLLSSGAALAADSDITGHWAEDTLQTFIDLGYLSGYEDGTYRPNNTITRAEMAAISNEVNAYTGSADLSGYTDVSPSDWFYGDLSAALDAGYLKGTSATTMAPNKNLTRAEGFTMVVNMLGLECDGTRADLQQFADADSVPDWAVPYVGALVRAGLVAGYESADGVKTIQTANQMTRAETVVMLNKCLLQQSGDVYVAMNIPYDAFYEAEVNNDVEVDAFTSATLNKTRTGSLAGGSYHVNSDGSDITGITFPVKLGEGVTLDDLAAYKRVTDADSVEITVTNRGQTSTTTYSGVDALFENPSYAYYVMRETPAFYKELTRNEDGSLSFGPVQGEAQTVSGVTAELTTETNYGDYEMVLSGFDEIDTSTDQVYGVVVHTEENDYGLRHLENIWRVTDLAWCTGFTDTVHNCPTSSAHYASMMGQTIQSVTYYTSKGIYELPLDGVYVPVKFEHTFSVADADAASGSTTVTLTGLPEDYQAAFAVTDADGTALEGAACDGAALTWTGTPEVGIYTLTMTDESGTYASYTAGFQLTTEAVVAAYDAENLRLVKADGVSDETFAAYLSGITSVSVDGTSYNASGRGSVTIVNEDGTINLDAASGETALFQPGSTYALEVTSTGYVNNLAFSLTVPRDVQTLTGTATTEPDEFLDFEAYDIAIDVVVENSVIQSIALSDGCTIDEENLTYFERAMNGRGSQTGIAAQLAGKTVSELSALEYDVVSTATCSSNAIVQAVRSAVGAE